MMSRNIARCARVAHNFNTSAAVCHGVKHISCSRVSSVPTSTIQVIVPRFYSQKLKMKPVEMPVVDFDYVKSAVSRDDVILIDVREPVEIKELGKIPNSINIPIGFVETNLAMSEKEFEETYKIPKPKANDEIIFYCKIGRRSGIAQRLAVNLGFNNTKNYLGSYTEWAVKNK